MHRKAVSAVASWTDWFTPWRFAAILGLLIVANFFTVLFGSETFFLRDFGYFSYPLAHYHRDCFWRGELPLWSPYNSCGMPYLAQWNTLTLYPPSLIYLLLPLPWSLNLFCVLHLFAGGLGMYFLAHHWTQNRFAASVAGLLFVFNGFMLNCLMWPNNIAALGLMPWVVLAVQRGWQQGGRKVLVAALVSAVQMLSGAPEMILMTWLMLGALFVVDAFTRQVAAVRGLLRVGAVVLLVAGIAAAQLLPFLELVRAADRTQEAATPYWPIPIWGWANFFVPLFHSYRVPFGSYFQPGQEWIASYYTGVCGVVLALTAVWKVRLPRVWLLAALAALSIALAFGDNGFLYPALRRLAPQLGFMRFPVKFLIVLNFVLPLLAAFAVSQLKADSSRRFARSLLITTGAVAVLIGGLVWFARTHLAPFEDWNVTLWSGLSRIMLIVAAAGLLWWLARSNRERTFRVMGMLVLALIFLDGVTHSPKANLTIPAEALQTGLLKFDEAGLQGHRALLTRPAYDEISTSRVSDPVKDFLLHRLALTGECNLIDRIPTADGFFSLYLRESRHVWSMLWFYQTNFTTSPLLDFLGVAHINAAHSVFDWTNRPSALPLATVGQRPIFAAEDPTLDALVSRSFHPRETVYLPLESKPLVTFTNGAEASITKSHFTAHRLDFEVTAKADTLLVVAQSFYGAWRAFADGKPTPILRANHGFQAVVVPAGQHAIVFEYRDNAFRLGAAITALALLLGTVLWFKMPKLN